MLKEKEEGKNVKILDQNYASLQGMNQTSVFNQTKVLDFGHLKCWIAYLSRSFASAQLLRISTVTFCKMPFRWGDRVDEMMGSNASAAT